jgi:hypothetical protein
MSTLKQFLDNTKDVTLSVPRTTSALSSFYVTVGNETMRVGSRALLEHRLDTPVFVLSETPTFENCAKHVFHKNNGYALTAMLAFAISLIGKNQAIHPLSRGCTTTR